MAARFTRTAKSQAEQRLPAPPEPTPGALPAEDLPARIGTYSDRDVWGIEHVRPIVPTAAQNDQVCMAQLFPHLLRSSPCWRGAPPRARAVGFAV